MSDAPTQAPAGDARARLVEKLMAAVKTGALYGQEHPQRLRIMSDAMQAFRAVEAEDGMVSVEVTPDGLTIAGLLVDAEDAPDLARRINAGGVRRLDLAASLEPEELDGLASLLALDFERMRLEDDLTTLLWEKNWANVHWEAFEVPTEEHESAEEPSGFTSSVPDEPPLEPLRMKDWGPEDFILTADEAAAIAEEVRVAETDPPIAEIGAVLCQVVALEKNVKYIEPLLESLRALVDRCLRTGKFSAAGETALLLDRFGKDPQALTEEKLRAIQECQATFAAAESIDAVLPVLERHEWDDPDAAVAFLEALPHDATPRLMDAFFSLASDEAREIVRRALAAHLRRNMEFLSGQLSTYRGDALVAIVRLLGDVGSKEVVPVLKETLRSGSAAVRLATLDSLALVGGAHARAVLVRALSDEDRDVRCRAAHVLPRMGASDGLEPLLREMLRGEFRKRDLGERMVFFRALGSTNAPEVLPFLRRILQRRGWAFLGRKDDERRCAAAALAQMSHPEAFALRADLVRGGAKDLEALIAEAGEEAA